MLSWQTINLACIYSKIIMALLKSVHNGIKKKSLTYDFFINYSWMVFQMSYNSLVKFLWGRVLCATQGLGVSRIDLTKLYMTWLELTCLGLTWLDLTNLDLTWLDFAWLDLPGLNWLWLDLTWLDITLLGMIWFDLTWIDLTWLHLAGLDLPWQYLTNSTCLLYHTSHKSELRKIKTLGSHPKLQIDKLGLLVCSTGASVWSFIKIRVELAEI